MPEKYSSIVIHHVSETIRKNITMLKLSRLFGDTENEVALTILETFFLEHSDALIKAKDIAMKKHGAIDLRRVKELMEGEK